MIETIQIKRGIKSNLPRLAEGELALCTDTGEVFIGSAVDGNKLIFLEDLATMQTQVNTNTTQLAQIVNKTIRINVLNPPADTGLLPLTMSDPVQDQTRLQAIFDYVLAHEINYKPNAEQGTGYDYTVYFPNGQYQWASTVTLKGGFLTLDADRAIIRTTDNSYAFQSSGGDAWKLKMKGFSFDRCSGLFMNNANMESGKTQIEECWFYYSPQALNITKQSSMTFIEKCHFYKCTLIGTFNLTDAVFMDKCWISEVARTTTNLVDIVNYTKLFISDTFFIPASQSDTTLECAWIENHGYVKVSNSRISSEPGSKTVVNNYSTASPQTSYNPNGVEVVNCSSLACVVGNYVIRLYAFPNILKVKGNQISPLTTQPIGYAASYTGSDIATFTGRQDICSVDVSGNVGQSSSAWSVPTALAPFIRIKDLGFNDASGITSAKTGTVDAATHAFTVNTSFTPNTNAICQKSYLVKLIGQPSGSAGTYLSTYIGILTFRATNALNSAMTLECKMNTLVQYSGGSTTSGLIDSSITVSAKFAASGTNQLAMSGTTPIGITISWDSAIAGSGLTYTIKEIMEAQ